ncbi:hypothetical protein Y032_0021g452 [Ancylostoma ceylanicum]|uniref:Uncharacterized protein n=1 Tax=Ancylostoma ceylanicum TaxID=53326 RepID=A0A016V262_9BILA|nr:hypothetical protein Y032_0021g452 [Ancylostoma ceylanicum]
MPKNYIFYARIGQETGGTEQATNTHMMVKLWGIQKLGMFNNKVGRRSEVVDDIATITKYETLTPPDSCDQIAEKPENQYFFTKCCSPEELL